MSEGSVAIAATELVAAMRAACDPATSESEAIVALREYGETIRRMEYQSIRLISALDRRGTFHQLGYRRTADAIADLLGWDRAVAHRRARVAADVISQHTPDGQPLPPKLQATAAGFEAAKVDLARVEVIATALHSGPASRVAPADWAVAEQQLAGYATAGARPAELRLLAQQLIGLLDQDGPDPDQPEGKPNSLRLIPRHEGGGLIRGELDAAGFATVATAIDALSTPQPEVRLGLDERQADALIDLCRFSLDHADLPDTGGERPHLNVTVPLAELESRARAALLDHGGILTPAQLRMLACDACVVPAVLGGVGQPLDLGRARRNPTAAVRRAVVIRDRCCAFPGCNRPPAWCDIHHVREWAKEHGETNPNNLTLLCRAHHRLCHQSGWQAQIRDGTPEFIPPKWIDPSQSPRRKPARQI